MNWTFVADVFPQGSRPDGIYFRCVVFLLAVGTIVLSFAKPLRVSSLTSDASSFVRAAYRPKVVFNAKTSRYVLWINYLPPASSPLKVRVAQFVALNCGRTRWLQWPVSYGASVRLSVPPPFVVAE